MVGRYSFIVFSLLLLLGMAYWSDRLGIQRPVRQEGWSTSTASGREAEATDSRRSSKAARAPAATETLLSPPKGLVEMENRPLEIEPVGEHRSSVDNK